MRKCPCEDKKSKAERESARGRERECAHTRERAGGIESAKERLRENEMESESARANETSHIL